MSNLLTRKFKELADFLKPCIVLLVLVAMTLGVKWLYTTINEDLAFHAAILEQIKRQNPVPSAPVVPKPN